jgi:hypothetical protein
MQIRIPNWAQIIFVLELDGGKYLRRKVPFVTVIQPFLVIYFKLIFFYHFNILISKINKNIFSAFHILRQDLGLPHVLNLRNIQERDFLSIRLRRLLFSQCSPLTCNHFGTLHQQ